MQLQEMKFPDWLERETGKSGILRGRLSTSYKNQADRWFVISAVASLFCWQIHYRRRQDRTLFWGSYKKLDRCMAGCWLPHIFSLGQAQNHHLDEIIWTLATQVVKHLTLLSNCTCLVTGSPTVELLPTIYAQRLAGKCLYICQN